MAFSDMLSSIAKKSRGGYKYQSDEESARDILAELGGRQPHLIYDRYKSVKSLPRNDPLYPRIRTYVANGQVHNFGLRVLNVIQLTKEDSSEFDNLPMDNYRMMLWHGSKRRNVASILENGFEIPSPDGQMLGQGIYFADRASKSALYFDKVQQASTGYLLLCDVKLGRCYNARKSHKEYKQAPVDDQGRVYNSVKCSGRYIPKENPDKKLLLDGSIIPVGVTVEDEKFEDYAIKFNEFVVYNPAQVQVKFVVKVSIKKRKASVCYETSTVPE